MLMRENYVRHVIFSNLIKDKRLQGKIVLVFGCGGGLYTSLFAEARALIVGIDVSKVAIKISQLQAENNKFNAHFVVASGENLPFKEGCFDMIFITEVLEHLLNPLNAIEETSRVLKNNGELVASIPCGDKFSVQWIITYLLGGPKRTKDNLSNFWPDYLADEHLQRFTNEEIKELYKKEGVIIYDILFYDHLFRHICHILRLILNKFKIKPQKLNFGKIELIDYKLFKKLPNGTGMIVSAKKAKV